MAEEPGAEVTSAEVTRDGFFGGRLVLEQPAKGHRSGTDAVLLAAAMPRDFSGLAYDVGAGVGAVGLGLALACPGACVTLVENDAACVTLAERNIAANGLQSRAEVATCDFLSREERVSALPRAADLILTNPPFYHADRVRRSPDAGRRAAHIMENAKGLENWLLACIGSLSARGTLVVLHQPEAVPEILNLLSPRLGGLTLIAVHPRGDQQAVRVLIRGRKGSRAPFCVVPPLILHEGDAFTVEAAALHAGTAALRW